MVRLSTATFLGALLSVVMVVAAVDCGEGKNHNLYFGQRSWTDSLAYTTKIQREGHWLRKVSADAGTGLLSKKISYIEAIDGNADGKGGCGYLTTGGVGDYVAKFHFKSQRGHGLNFTLNVYTH